MQLRLYDFMKQTQRKSQDMQRNIDQLSQHVRSREEELSSTKEVGEVWSISSGGLF